MTRAADLLAIDAALTRIGRVATSRRAARLRSRRSGVEVSALGIAVLATVYRRGPVNLRAVSAAVDTQPSRVSKEVAALRGHGYVRQAVDPADRRATVLTVTAAGRRAFERYRRAADDLLAETLAGWRAGDLHALAGLLTRLADDIAPTGAAGPAGRPGPAAGDVPPPP